MSAESEYIISDNFYEDLMTRIAEDPEEALRSLMSIPPEDDLIDYLYRASPNFYKEFMEPLYIATLGE